MTSPCAASSADVNHASWQRQDASWVQARRSIARTSPFCCWKHSLSRPIHRRAGDDPGKIVEHPLRTAWERYARIDAMKGGHAVDLPCEMPRVSRSGIVLGRLDDAFQFLRAEGAPEDGRRFEGGRLCEGGFRDAGLVIQLREARARNQSGSLLWLVTESLHLIAACTRTFLR